MVKRLTAIQLITDSGSDLPLTFLKEHNISLIPLKVHLREEEFEDLVTIDAKTVYDAMRQGAAPKTSQGSPNTMKELFTKLAREEKTAIYFAFSSELSGTYSTANIIRDQVREEYPDFDLTIVDTKCASLGQGLVVRHAAMLLKNGADKETILQECTFMAEHMEHLFTVDNLDYLQRGGRISKTSAVVGGLLNIKPLLNVEDGKLVPLEKIRGEKRLVKRMIELIGERGVDLENQVIGISHADSEEVALRYKQLLEETYNCKTFVINMIGAAIGAHAGPGTIAIFFLNEKMNTSLDFQQ